LRWLKAGMAKLADPGFRENLCDAAKKLRFAWGNERCF
jgi:hypothetical protein